MLHRRGVPVTLSTDDLTVSDITLSEEYSAAVTEIGLRLDELWAINRGALAHAFADSATVARLTCRVRRVGRRRAGRRAGAGGNAGPAA